MSKEKELSEREVRIMAVIDACEDILSAPESTQMIKRFAIDAAYKRIVSIMREEETQCSDSSQEQS